MTSISRFPWILTIALGAVALVRPVASLTGLDDVVGRPATPIILTIAITLFWVAIVGLRRTAHPFLTLVGAGVVYAIASTALSAVVSPILTGTLQGPLTNPFALVSVIVTNVAWGALAGLLALGVRKLLPRA
jgi:hypothetical protein